MTGKRVVIDTNIIIDHLRQSDSIQTKFSYIALNYDCVISTITISELWAGNSMSKSSNIFIVEELIKSCTIVTVDSSIAKKAGELTRGQPSKIFIPDAVIAATALRINAPLVTLNKKDFRKIPDLELIDL